MMLLTTGLVIFLGIHLLPMFANTRNAVCRGLGNNAYRGLFSLIAATGLGLIIWGMSRAPFLPMLEPPAFARPLAIAFMPVVFILFAAAQMPGHLRRLLRHPMLIATLLWSTVHLLANGDQASLVLFGSFGLWAVMALISAGLRTKSKPKLATSWRMDAAAIVLGLLAYVLVARFHGALFGVPLV
jgi:uncharacterized membrane protein